jgi:ribosomal protein L11 methyltransferase
MTKTKSIWKVIKFDVPRAEEDLASWLMIDSGSSGCEIEPGTDAVTISAFFESDRIVSMEALAIRFEEYGLAKVLPSLKHEDVEERDWLEQWKACFTAFPIGQNFYVCPSWESEAAENETCKGRSRLLIEPGMAFGTGLHATTQFCLGWLEKRLFTGPVLDVGTGSGILAIAVALLDRSVKITAIDNDPNSIENAELNLRLNGMQERIELLLAEPKSVHGGFGTILSNMTCEDIIALLPTYKRLLKADGVVIGAGILKEKLNLLRHAQKEFAFVEVESEESGQWAGVVMRSS